MRRLPIPMGLLDTQVDDVRTPFDYSAPSLNPAKKRDWRASMFDRLVPQGDANMDDADKTRSFRQGLLQLAAGLQSGPNFGEALTKGLTGGLLSMNKGVDDLQDRQFKQQTLRQNAMGGSSFMALHQQAIAAGYEPGTPKYQEFMRRANGEIARQSSAAIQYKEVEGPDGVKRMVALDPRDVGAQVIGSGQTYGSGVQAPQPSATPAPMPAPTSGGGAALMQNSLGEAVRSVIGPLGGRITAGYDPTGAGHNGGSDHYKPDGAYDIGMGRESPQQQAQIIAALEGAGFRIGDERQRPAGQAKWTGPHLHVTRAQQAAAAQSVPQPAGVNAFAGSRPKEVEAAAVQGAQIDATNARAGASAQTAAQIEAAKTAAQIDATNVRAGASAATAGTIEAGKVTGQKSAERQQEGIGALPVVESNAKQTLAVIDKALTHPGKKDSLGWGSYNPLNKLPGKAHDFQIVHEQIKGKAFLEAFNSLRGGGAITEKEGDAATKAIARLDTSQTPAEYDAALRELKGIVNTGLMRARAQAGASPPRAPAGPKVDDLLAKYGHR